MRRKKNGAALPSVHSAIHAGESQLSPQSNNASAAIKGCGVWVEVEHTVPTAGATPDNGRHTRRYDRRRQVTESAHARYAPSGAVPTTPDPDLTSANRNAYAGAERDRQSPPESRGGRKAKAVQSAPRMQTCRREGDEEKTLQPHCSKGGTGSPARGRTAMDGPSFMHFSCPLLVT